MSQQSFSRRRLIQYGGGFVGTSLTATVLGSQLIKTSPAVAEAAPAILAQNKDITPEQALNKLLEGNKRFVTQKRTKPNQTVERLVEVAQG
jgi:carbonic anhydrase